MTQYPTPAADFVASIKEKHDRMKDEYVVTQRAVLFQSLTKEQAVEQALQFLDVPKSSVSKKEAINEIVEDAWAQTPTAALLRDAETKARFESRVLRNIEQAEGADVTYFTKRIHEKVDSAPYESRNIMDDVISLRVAMRKGFHWQGVAQHIAEDCSPTEALAKYRAYLTKQVLYAHNHDALSRSTSVLSNIVKDVDMQTDAVWLDETDWS